MKTLRTAIFASTFVLAAAAFAQYPAGGQATQPMHPQPGSMQPSQPQTQPDQQPAQPGTTQPGTTQPGATQPGSTTQSQASQSAAQHASIDDQVQSLSQQLSLSADQQAKVKSALEDQHTQAMTIVQDNAMAREDKIQKIHTLREGTIAKVRTALNDDQKKKFDVMIQQMEQRQQQQPQGQPK